MFENYLVIESLWFIGLIVFFIFLGLHEQKKLLARSKRVTRFRRRNEWGQWVGGTTTNKDGYPDENGKY